MNIEIRQEKGGDIQAVYRVNEKAFGQDNEPRLVNLLRKSYAYVPGLSLVAVMDDEVVGQILLSRILLS